MHPTTVAHGLLFSPFFKREAEPASFVALLKCLKMSEPEISYRPSVRALHFTDERSQVRQRDAAPRGRPVCGRARRPDRGLPTQASSGRVLSEEARGTWHHPFWKVPARGQCNACPCRGEAGRVCKQEHLEAPAGPQPVNTDLCSGHTANVPQCEKEGSGEVGRLNRDHPVLPRKAVPRAHCLLPRMRRVQGTRIRTRREPGVFRWGGRGGGE